MSWTNYHSHTRFCDGSDEPELYIENAIKQGMVAYGYSSHAPVGFNTEWTIPDDLLNVYLEKVGGIKEKYSNKIETYLGLEVDYIPGQTGRCQHLLKNIELDYFISSIHYVDAFEDGTHWNIDHNKEVFDKGLSSIFNGNFRKASERFYEITRQMIIEDTPDIIGHLDKIKMFNNGGQYFSESDKWYKDLVEETINIIKKSGAIVEINTRGYYRYKQEDLYPSQWIIEKLAKKDIPVMLNSDSHKPHELTEGFAYAASRLEAAGVKYLWALIGGKWSGFEYTSRGLVL